MPNGYWEPSKKKKRKKATKKKKTTKTKKKVGRPKKKKVGRPKKKKRGRPKGSKDTKRAVNGRRKKTTRKKKVGRPKKKATKKKTTRRKASVSYKDIVEYIQQNIQMLAQFTENLTANNLAVFIQNVDTEIANRVNPKSQKPKYMLPTGWAKNF